MPRESKSSAGSSRRGIPKTSVTVATKLEILKKFNEGLSVKTIMVQYGLGKSTVYDIKYAKEKILKFAEEQDSDVTVRKRTRMDPAKFKDIEDATFKWYKQQSAAGVTVRGTELQQAAKRFAQILEKENFVASSGWLHRFKIRHGLHNNKLTGEATSTDIGAVGPFKEKLKGIIFRENLSKSQLYNAEESGLFWKLLPSNTRASRSEGHNVGRRVSKERMSVLFCANADGTHRIPVAVVKKSQQSRVLRDCMSSLPVTYYASASAWFTADIFHRWFHDVFVPAVLKFQREASVSEPDVRALLILDNTPAHPSDEKLTSKCGRIRVIFLPPNTAGLIQPMDQGVIEVTKRRYKRKLMESCLAIDEGDDEEADTRTERTFANYRSYNINNAIFNIANSWKEMPSSALANSWRKVLLEDRAVASVEDDLFQSLKPIDFLGFLKMAGEKGVALGDVEEWLSSDLDDMGYRQQTEEEIAEEAINETQEEEEVKIKLSEARKAADLLVSFFDTEAGQDVFHNFGDYAFMQCIRNRIIQRQWSKIKHLSKTKIGNFFKPLSHSSAQELRPTTRVASSQTQPKWPKGKRSRLSDS
ncbi:tigger transposable element-derived protein 7-like [Callorhinchus milii]|uniref:tigger transposable element-derived protein 7-like n=1 Tax=Callorhinchus milii TaxID=7868 RepID=UPI001C3F6542|nr:tigger transposable element-derived protein 7-like [Callorhinchus milii]